MKPKYSLQNIADMMSDGNASRLSEEYIANITSSLAQYNQIWANTFGALYAKKRTDPQSHQQAIKGMGIFVEFIKTHHPQNTYSVLDIGAGAGEKSAALATYEGFNVSVLEPATFFVENNLMPLKNKGVLQNIFTDTAENMCSCEDNSYDVLMSNAVLHRLLWFKNKNIELEAAIAEMHRILKPNGIVFIRTLAKTDAQRFFVDEQTGRFFNRMEMQAFNMLLENKGFEILSSTIKTVSGGPMGELTPWLNIFARKI